MIVETTYTDKVNDHLIDDVVGKAFSFLETFKLKGSGSRRMIIENVSPNMKQYINSNSSLNYANIELRPGGIIIRMNKGLQNFAWVIPYYQLVMYKANGASLHAQGKFIHFKNTRTFKENKSFFSKMSDEKIKHDVQYSFY